MELTINLSGNQIIAICVAIVVARVIKIVIDFKSEKEEEDDNTIEKPKTP